MTHTSALAPLEKDRDRDRDRWFGTWLEIGLSVLGESSGVSDGEVTSSATLSFRDLAEESLTAFPDLLRTPLQGRGVQ